MLARIRKRGFLVERRSGFAAVEWGRGAWHACTARPIHWVDRKSRIE